MCTWWICASQPCLEVVTLSHLGHPYWYFPPTFINIRTSPLPPLFTGDVLGVIAQYCQLKLLVVVLSVVVVLSLSLLTTRVVTNSLPQPDSLPHQKEPILPGQQFSGLPYPPLSPPPPTPLSHLSPPPTQCASPERKHDSFFSSSGSNG